MKLIFFDVDGTLLPANSVVIPEDAVEALKRTQEKGNKIFLCTGRYPTEVKDFTDIGFDGYVFLNGQLCLDRDLNPIFSNPISGYDREELLKVFETRQIPAILVEMDRMFELS